jgi:hypothetical protein
MSATRQIPGPAAVAWWLRTLKIHAQGCIQLVPDGADPADVAAYNEARRQLAAEPKTEAGGDGPEASP